MITAEAGTLPSVTVLEQLATQARVHWKQHRGYIEGVEEIEDHPAATMGDRYSSMHGLEYDSEHSEYRYDWHGSRTPTRIGSIDGESSHYYDRYGSQPGEPQMPNCHGEGPSYTGDFNKDPYANNPAEEIYQPEAPKHTSEGRRPVIAVMGRTGSGKTSFIKTIAGDKAKDLIIGKNLHSCMHSLFTNRISYTHVVTGTQEVQKVTCRVGGIDIDLIDTPGFDDTKLSDTEVLARIADYLKYTYDEGIRLTGLIYLYPISNNRMDGSAVKYLNVFRALCGDGNLSNVILATTMWSKVSSSEGREREASLIDDFWGIMIDQGSTVERVSKHQDRQQDKALVERLLPKHTVVLQLQQEMSEGRKLADTTVGCLIFERLTRRVTELEKELELTQTESRRAIKKGRWRRRFIVFPSLLTNVQETRRWRSRSEGRSRSSRTNSRGWKMRRPSFRRATRLVCRRMQEGSGEAFSV